MSEIAPEAWWKPITRSELDQLVDRELAGMVEPFRAYYRSYAVEPYRTACAHSGFDDSFYVVAQLGNQVVVYNDIEEDFGVGTLAESGPMTDRADYGPLVLALRVLVEEVPTATSKEAP